ncbi:methyltransferase [Bacillus timonensis]|nr:methyltransferase [Bacillus timonensis]
MGKILIEVFVPSIEKTFDVFIPLNLKLHEVELLISGAIADLSNGYFIRSEDTVLCDREKGIILDINQSAMELGFKNGTTLMLI